MFGSPFVFLFSDFTPAVIADGDYFSVNLDVKFDVFAVAGILPRVFTMFNVMFHDFSSKPLWRHFCF
jgi:hypothetical protein